MLISICFLYRDQAASTALGVMCGLLLSTQDKILSKDAFYESNILHKLITLFSGVKSSQNIDGFLTRSFQFIQIKLALKRQTIWLNYWKSKCFECYWNRMKSLGIPFQGCAYWGASRLGGQLSRSCPLPV